MNITKQERDEAIGKLKAWLTPGATVYTVLRHVSKSGMQRRIDCYYIGLDDNEKARPVFLTGYLSKALGMRWDDRKGGLIVNGCGMDMGFHIVNNLAQLLHGDGQALNHRWL